jgi:hypothetical protein
MKKRMSNQQRALVRKLPLQKETEGLAGAQLQVQLEPVEGAQMFLMLNDSGHIGYPAARSPREEDIMPMLNLVRHKFMPFSSV